MSKQERHIRCLCLEEVLARTKGKCACKARGCLCPGCSGARKARGANKPATEAAN